MHADNKIMRQSPPGDMYTEPPESMMKAVLELVDAVRARHVTPEIPVYYTVVAEP